mmetsp:Transcript_31599/g.64322  ORF Transcript_31599/g.64322 Transcript_31599/m.64322 type:complete len:230 (+) Transcript_31599:314-1003(+)
MIAVHRVSSTPLFCHIHLRCGFCLRRCVSLLLTLAPSSSCSGIMTKDASIPLLARAILGPECAHPILFRFHLILNRTGKSTCRNIPLLLGTEEEVLANSTGLLPTLGGTLNLLETRGHTAEAAGWLDLLHFTGCVNIMLGRINASHGDVTGGLFLSLVGRVGLGRALLNPMARLAAQMADVAVWRRRFFAFECQCCHRSTNSHLFPLCGRSAYMRILVVWAIIEASSKK